MRQPVILFGIWIGAAFLGASGPPAAAAEKIEIVSVGHEGYLIRGGGAAVLIDGFLGPGESERDTLVRRSLGELIAGRPPFDRVTLALISHPHDDHFDAMVAGTFLQRHRETTFATTSDVLAALRKDFPGAAALRGRLVEVKWGAGRRIARTVAGLKVDFVRMPHEASQFYPEDVALHIIQVNGMKVMHGADPELLHGQLLTMNLEKEAIDVAFLPYSFLATPGAGKLYAEHIHATKLVAMHLPAAGVEQAKAVVREQFPDAIFLVTPLESIRL